MANRRINTALWTAAAAFAVGGVAVLTWAALAPLAGSGGVGSEVKRATAGRKEHGIPPIESFGGALQARLRRPLTDGELQVADTGAANAAAAGPPLTLVGTIGTSLAMLRTPSTQVEVRAVGETLLGAEVVAVRPAQVDLRYNGKVVTLSKPPEQPVGQ